MQAQRDDHHLGLQQSAPQAPVAAAPQGPRIELF